MGPKVTPQFFQKAGCLQHPEPLTSFSSKWTGSLFSKRQKPTGVHPASSYLRRNVFYFIDLIFIKGEKRHGKATKPSPGCCGGGIYQDHTLHKILHFFLAASFRVAGNGVVVQGQEELTQTTLSCGYYSEPWKTDNLDSTVIFQIL